MAGSAGQGADGVPARPPAGSAAGVRGEGRRRILVVDDTLINRRVLRAMLRQDGHEVLEAEDGVRALELARAERPDLVLLDVMMPVMDGYTACAELKRDPVLADTPVIFLSSRDEPEDKVRGLRLGAADYIAKPFHAEEVRARVSTHLQLRQLTCSLQRLNGELLAKQARLEEDLRAAADIQRALMPRARQPLPGFCIAWRFVPCSTVGGDIFNVHCLEGSCAAVYMLDVSGHGVPSAMVTVSVARTLSPDGGVVMREGVASPREVMRELEHEYPFERFERFFTVSYLVVDVASGRVRYTSAAHPPPLLVPRTGPARLLTEGGPLLGLGVGETLEEGEVALSPGDRLVLYTDGAFELTDPRGALFGLERLHGLIEQHRHLDVEGLCDRVLQTLDDYRGGAPPEDDVTLLVLEYRGAEGAH
ncbi:PP2C family protein-serine/threonine phosphatase [Archangium sp.]|uniref:PP2C family protein-serine/threonine phosphatase n=1 Tax=Archangium sp. TaxID=1872627 RepID=UPI002EDA9D1B